MATRQAISMLTKHSSAPVATSTVLLHCLVRPGAAKVREGIASITDEVIEVNVAAPPQDGKANKAVIQMLAEALSVSRAELQIVQGAKGREKTISVPRRALGIGSPLSASEREDSRLIHLVRDRLQSQVVE